MTLRSSNRGYLAMDVALSLSYCASTRVTNALLLGNSTKQAAFIHNQVIQLAAIAGHPALLPTLVSVHCNSLLKKLIDDQIDALYLLENKTGQTFVALISDRGPLPKGNEPDEDISNKALGVVQLVTTWECYTKSLLLQIDSIKQFIRDVAEKTMDDSTEDNGYILSERLEFISREGNVMLYKAQWIKDRASAQIAAVRTY